MVELDDGHGEGDGQKMDQVFLFGKEEREKQKWAQDKGITYRAIFGLYSIHHRGCEWFRIDSHTIKRGNSRELWLSSATR